MPLTQLSLSAKLAWTLQALNGAFGPGTQGPDSEYFNLLNVSLSSWNQLYANNVVLLVAAPSGLEAALASGGTLSVGTTYYYKITGTGGSAGTGETTGSNEASATPTTGNQSVKLTWSQLPQAGGYKVYRGTAAGSENVLIATITSGSMLTYTDTGSAGTASSPPGSMPPNYLEFSLSSFTSLTNESVSPGHALSIFVNPAGINAQCLLTPGATNGLTWFFSGTSPGINIPVTASSGNGGTFLLSAPYDNAGQAITGSANTLRITNNGTGNLSCTVLVIVGP